MMALIASDCCQIRYIFTKTLALSSKQLGVFVLVVIVVMTGSAQVPYSCNPCGHSLLQLQANPWPAPPRASASPS